MFVDSYLVCVYVTLAFNRAVFLYLFIRLKKIKKKLVQYGKLRKHIPKLVWILWKFSLLFPVSPTNPSFKVTHISYSNLH